MLSCTLFLFHSSNCSLDWSKATKIDIERFCAMVSKNITALPFYVRDCASPSRSSHSDFLDSYAQDLVNVDIISCLVIYSYEMKRILIMLQMLPKLFVLSVMFLVLYRHLKSLFLNYHVFDSFLFHHLFLFFCALSIIIIIITLAAHARRGSIGQRYRDSAMYCSFVCPSCLMTPCSFLCPISISLFILRNDFSTCFYSITLLCMGLTMTNCSH